MVPVVGVGDGEEGVNSFRSLSRVKTVLQENACLMNGKEKILDQLKNNHLQCQNLVLARGWHLRQRSGEIELILNPRYLCKIILPEKSHTFGSIYLNVLLQKYIYDWQALERATPKCESQVIIQERKNILYTWNSWLSPCWWGSYGSHQGGEKHHQALANYLYKQ